MLIYFFKTFDTNARINYSNLGIFGEEARQNAIGFANLNELAAHIQNNASMIFVSTLPISIERLILSRQILKNF